jgi:hypothetical protein
MKGRGKFGDQVMNGRIFELKQQDVKNELDSAGSG